jgi:hypothetical protein
MKSCKLASLLCLLVSLFLLNGCSGKKYEDVKEVNGDMVTIMDEYAAEIDKSANAQDVVKAINRFADKMEALVPKMKKLAEKYPELENMDNPPEELKESQAKAEAVGQKIAGSMMKIMPYMNDPEVKKAQERMSETMMNMGK